MIGVVRRAARLLAIALGSPLPAWAFVVAGFLVFWLTDGAAKRRAAV